MIGVFILTLLSILLIETRLSRSISKRLDKTWDSIWDQMLSEVFARAQVFAHDPVVYGEVYLNSSPSDVFFAEADRQIRSGLYEPAILRMIFDREIRKN